MEGILHCCTSLVACSCKAEIIIPWSLTGKSRVIGSPDLSERDSRDCMNSTRRQLRWRQDEMEVRDVKNGPFQWI